MNAWARFALIAALASSLTACGTKGQAIKPDSNGYLPTGAQGEAARARTVVAERIDTHDFKGLALVTATDSTVTQVRNLGYFGETIDLKELQRRIVEKGIQDKVPAVNDRIGINNAARYYQKFLWIHYDSEKRDGKSFVKLIGTDPMTLRDVFVAERELVNPILTWNGYTDQNTWYPLFNSFIEWLKSN
ncbi:MAG: hypothetical protein ABW187_09225 [Dokdonella sp.]